MALQNEEVLEVADYAFDKLALAGGPPTCFFGPRPPCAPLRRGGYESPVFFQPSSLPPHTDENPLSAWNVP